MDALGRFRSARPLTCRRGDRVVVRTHRGLEVGEVLRATSSGHAHFFPNTSVGPLLRPLGPEDEAAAETARRRGRQLFDDAVGLASELALGLEVIDAEI